MINTYIGLLRADGTEPDKASGYRRTYIGKTEEELPGILAERQVVFPDVTAPGYGIIAAAALYDREEGGDPMDTWQFPEALDVHEGVVPVIHKGRLWRGVEAKATVCVRPNAQSGIGGSLW